MRTLCISALCAFYGVAAFEAPAQNSQSPVVTGVTAAQQPFPSKDVVISYTISDPVSTSDNVWIIVSADGGSTWTVPATNFSGAYGPNVAVTPTPSVNAVTWHAGTDWNGNYTTNCRVRVIACNNGMVLVPAGRYNRGDNLDGEGDAPVYAVSVSAFLMDNYLVSGSLWSLVSGYAASHGYGFDHAGSYKATTHPVQTVNWYDAVKWCNARSQMEGVSPIYYTDAACTVLYTNLDVDAVYLKAGANGYRLPTEAEWEKAARGALAGMRFPWGNTIRNGPPGNGGQANYYGNKEVFSYDLGPDYPNSAYNDGIYPYTSPVGAFAPNGYGLYDMAGNVFEWCWDWYGSSSYGSGQTDPRGPASGTYRVLRGGAWSEYADVARCPDRSRNQPAQAANYYGFRCVRGF